MKTSNQEIKRAAHSDPPDWPVCLLETIVRDRWQTLRHTHPRVHLFGAGEHTKWLLSVLQGIDGPEIAAILDDCAAPGAMLSGHPVILPSSTNPEAVSAIVISTDNTASPLITRCHSWAANATLISLYDNMPPGPYRKHTPAQPEPQDNPMPTDTELPPEIHQLRLRLPALAQHLFRLLLPLIHPPLSRALRARYRIADAITDAFVRESTIAGLQYVRDVFYPPMHHFMRIAAVDGTGLKLQLNLCEIESGNLYFGRDFERLETEALRTILSAGDCVIDGGSHIGLFSLLAAKLVGPEGSVHSFEANPDVYALSLENATINNVYNITANHIALAEQPGEVTLCINEDTSLSSLTDTGRGRVTGKIRVKATSLDEYAQRESLSGVKLLKLDLEGFEWDVLKGATNLISRNPDMAILCELAPRNLTPRNIKTPDVLTWVRRQGLRIWEFDTAHRRLVRLNGCTPQYGYRNYFFAGPDSDTASLLDILTNGIPGGITP